MVSLIVKLVSSKRWKPLWMSVPQLKYEDSNLNTEYHTFSRFVHRSLFFHKTQVLEKFKLSQCFSYVDIGHGLNGELSLLYIGYTLFFQTITCLSDSQMVCILVKHLGAWNFLMRFLLMFVSRYVFHLSSICISLRCYFLRRKIIPQTFVWFSYP